MIHIMQFQVSSDGTCSYDMISVNSSHNLPCDLSLEYLNSMALLIKVTTHSTNFLHRTPS